MVNINIYILIEILTLNCKSYLQGSILWISIIFIKFFSLQLLCTETLCVWINLFLENKEMRERGLGSLISTLSFLDCGFRSVWRNQMENQNSYNEEE